MSQHHRNQVPNPTPQDQDGASLLTKREKLSARQAKREAKAAERREKSEAFKDEGNAFFRKGDYQSAIDRYQKAIRVHGWSVKPILLTNLATAYYKLGMFCEAGEAAEKALDGDPKSVKARYRRAMARKSMEMWRAAAIDFRIVLRLDPRYQEVKKELAYVEKHYRENLFLGEEDSLGDSEHELPAPDDQPELGESLSESSDCEHRGNGKPCKFYNHTECTKGPACPFSHAPDNKSERDGLGRNVCWYYLMGICRFGERCSYLHSKEFLLQKGWWSTAEGIDKVKKIYEVQQKFKQAYIDYEMDKRSSNPERGPVPRQKHSGKKKKSAHLARPDLSRPPFEAATTVGGDRFIKAESGQSSRPTNSINQIKYTHSSPEDDDSYDRDEEDEYEHGMFGFTSSEVEELLCHGIKPWGDIEEARHFLDALHDGYRKIDALQED